MPQVTVIHGGKSGVVDLSKSFGLVVVYSNARVVNRVPNHLDLEDQLIRYYLSTPCQDPQDLARSGGRSGSYLRRKWWGFSQNMPVSRECYRQFNLKTRRVIVNRGRHIGNGVNLPACSTEMFDPIPCELKEYLFSLMETGQAVLRKYWDGGALNCRSRNAAFSKKLNAQMGREHLQANFEYYDLQMMTSDDVLLRRLDVSQCVHTYRLCDDVRGSHPCHQCKGDHRKNYNHSYVHSFTRAIDGAEYIMIFAMTTRWNVGVAMEHISGWSRPLEETSPTMKTESNNEI